jgi:hypothetical protein
MPIRHQHHGGIAVAVAIAVGGLHQAADFGIGQILAGPQFFVRATERRGNCSIFSGWPDKFEVGFRHGFPSAPGINCSNNSYEQRQAPIVV